MTTGAGMIFGRGVNTVCQLRCFVGVTGFAINFSNVVRMGIFLDVRMAVIALQAAVDAGAELVAVYRDAVACCVLHRLVAMACQAVRLRREKMGRQDKGECNESGGCFMMSDIFEEAG